MMTLNELLKDSSYKLSQFSAEQIQALENGITLKDTRGKATPYVTCLVRNKEIKLTPEEAMRQLYLRVLMENFGYPVGRIAVEYGVTFGRETKRADICVFDKDRPTVPYILVEVKKAQTQRRQRTTQKLLQRHRRTDCRLDERRPNFLLPTQRPQLLPRHTLTSESQ